MKGFVLVLLLLAVAWICLRAPRGQKRKPGDHYLDDARGWCLGRRAEVRLGGERDHGIRLGPTDD